MNNKEENMMPRYVIRFFGKTDYALECIALKQITFLHLEQLNDPFDPILDYVTDFDDNYEFLLSHVSKHHPEQLMLFKERLPEQNWREVVSSWSRLASDMRKATFVFSTCGVIEGNHPRDSLYMWGHYGNGHRGVAIEFDSTVLADWLIKKGSPQAPWWRMDYMNEIPKIKCEDVVEFVLNAKPDTNNLESYGPKLADVIIQRLHAKGKIWENENEWRLVRKNDETKLNICRDDLPDNAVTAVYLGCRAAEQERVRNDFVYETRRNFSSASVFCSKMRKGEYALDFEKIV